MKIFISGGAKSGKSIYAQRLAKAQSVNVPLYYIATMKSADSEDDERIAKHRSERDGWGFTTIEQPVDIEKILGQCVHNGSFLLDSLTALLANEMFLPEGSINEQAAGKITEGLLQILGRIENIVIVSDYIYSDAILYDSITENYRRALAEIDRTVANLCGVVLEAVYANVIVHKGGEAFDAIYQKMF
jgi:adenosylcobinamide kinase/adenosylcobinamide-phosphate guanylyltransferase